MKCLGDWDRFSAEGHDGVGKGLHSLAWMGLKRGASPPPKKKKNLIFLQMEIEHILMHFTHCSFSQNG